MPIVNDATQRGFSIFGMLEDTKGSKIRVQKSSAACEDAIWIFTNHANPKYENPEPHLNKEQVKDLIEILQHAYEHMEE